MVVQLNLGGYTESRNLLAQRFTRGTHSVFLVAMPLHLVESYLPIPNPEEPFEGNRRVNLLRANKFGDYWRQNAEWVAPPLLVDTKFKLSESFESLNAAGGVELGVLSFPQDSKKQLNILDGQHRILGIFNARNRLYDEKRMYEDQFAAQESEVTKAKLDNVLRLIERMNLECLSIEIIEGIKLETHKQFFHDIAVNAKGINKAVAGKFDQRQIQNRVALEVAENHPLLAGNTEFESDKVGGANPNLISLKSITDIVNEVSFGITKRISPVNGKELNDQNLAKLVSEFFDCLIANFSELDKIATGDITAAELRTRSMLTSPTILRHLANAFGELAVDKSNLAELHVTVQGLAKCNKLFAELAKNMQSPANAKWYSTGYFDEGAKAPSSKTQHLKGLSALIVQWGTDGKCWTN